MPCTTAHHLSNGILHCHKWYFTLCHKTLSSALRAPASRNPLPHPPARAPCGAPRCAALAAVLFGTRPTRGRAPGFSDAPGEPRPAPRARTVRPGGLSTASLPSYAGRGGAERRRPRSRPLRRRKAGAGTPSLTRWWPPGGWRRGARSRGRGPGEAAAPAAPSPPARWR